MANSAANNQSAVWDLARIDEQDYKLAWCKIKTREECNIPIKRGDKKVKNLFMKILFKLYCPSIDLYIYNHFAR